MLVELAVTDLGVIDHLVLPFGPGLTVVSGETGAGKTLVVTAIDLLLGGRADPGLVRSGRDEAVVEGRFVDGSEEILLRRVLPAAGRSRAYVDGRLATAGELTEIGSRLVDLHGQHEHQSLLSASAQRDSLDRYGPVDLEPLRNAMARRSGIEARLAEIGGDERERARTIDLLRYQADELERAGLRPDEDVELEAEQALLADAVAHREAADRATRELADDGGAGEQVARALAAIGGRSPFAPIETRLSALASELADVASELRMVGERIEDDPERLEAISERLRHISDLKRKYGADIGEILDFGREVAGRLADLEGRDALAAEVQAERDAAQAEVVELERVVGAARRAAAPGLSRDVTGHLASLALPEGRFEVEVGHSDPGDDVRFCFTANPGIPPGPLSKVASGGELARLMLALRLVLTAGPETLVFDEVDAGIGGETALAVGRALAALTPQHQVLVVTHLPQVAAHGDAQVAVRKEVGEGTTRTSASVLDPDERVVELSRMLSGTPESNAARDHAVELLAAVAADRGR